MKRKDLKFKAGIASFYLVTFTTLILTIMTASFATVVVSEVTRSSNNELSESAYDAAMAGVEDAKLAYANFQRCLTAERLNTLNDTNARKLCNDMKTWVESSNNNSSDCDMVGRMTGRLAYNSASDEYASGEVILSDSDESNNMNQAYTCTTIKTELNDYQATLTSEQQVRVIRGVFTDDEASDIKVVRLSWYSTREDDTLANYANFRGGQVGFPSKRDTGVAKPPTLEVQIVQTAREFQVAELMAPTDSSGRTDRATLYLVPGDDDVTAGTQDTYIGVVPSAIGPGKIEASYVASTNDQTIKHLPFGVKCDYSTNSDYACSVDIELPDPLNSTGASKRNGDTFALLVAVPYGEPDTDIMVQFLCGDSGCTATGDGEGGITESVITLQNLQVEIDSTGRANDLYRRVVTRLEPSDTAFSYPYYALELLGNNTENVLSKEMTVLCEKTYYIKVDNYSPEKSSGCSDSISTYVTPEMEVITPEILNPTAPTRPTEADTAGKRVPGSECLGPSGACNN